MKKHILILLAMIGLFAWGCATPGQKFLDISSIGDHERTQSGTIGLAPFQDRRINMGQGYVGFRVLLNNTQETYFVKGLSLADTLTQTMGTFLEKKGFTPVLIDRWEPGVDGIETASKECEQILTGQINRFECRAHKKGATTDMVLDIDLTFFLGLARTHALKTIPVSLTLERTELRFTPEKLEQFINQALEEIIQKALAF